MRKSMVALSFITLACIPITLALVIVDSVVASSCIYYMKQFDWGCNSTGNGATQYTCRCGNIDWLGSIANCIYSESTDIDERNHALKHVGTRCYDKSKKVYDYEVLDFIQFYENATDFLKYPDSTKDIEDQVMHPLEVNQTDFKYYFDSFQNVMDHVSKTQWFGWGLNFYWVVIIVISFVYNYHNFFFSFIPSRKWNRIKGRIIQSALFKNNNYNTIYYLADLIPIMLPSTIEFATIIIFWILVIIFSIVGYDMMLPNAYLGSSKFFYLLDFISYRTCITAFSLLPSMYFMGIRNTPLTYVVNWSRRTFISFHKTIAMAMSLLAFIHSCLWTAYTIREGDYAMWAVDAYWQWGMVSMILLGLILFSSLKWFRMVMYDCFLILHHVFSIVFIVAIYYHVNTLGWLGWCYSIIAIYSWDKLLRIFKIAISGNLIKKSTVEHFDESIIKLSIPRDGMKFKFMPGQYTFLYFLQPYPLLNAWQSHPFSLYMDPLKPNCLTAIIKVKKGITRKIYDYILRESMKVSNDNLEIPLVMEGVYGNSLVSARLDPTHDYVLIASGIGITSIYPYVLELLNQQRSNQTTIRLFWIVRDLNELVWFHNELKFLYENYCDTNQTSPILRIELIVTRNLVLDNFKLSGEENSSCTPNSSSLSSINHAHETAEEESKMLDDQELPSEEKILDDKPSKFTSFKNNSCFKVSMLPVGSRPCLSNLIRINKIRNATHFIVCGPSKFSDSIRSMVNVYRLELDCNYDIEYHEESFEW